MDDRGRYCALGHICLSHGIDRVWLYRSRSVAHLVELGYEVPEGLEWAYEIDPSSGLITDTEKARAFIRINDEPGLSDQERLNRFYEMSLPYRLFPT